jgi:hypothetical protein
MILGLSAILGCLFFAATQSQDAPQTASVNPEEVLGEVRWRGATG